MRQTKAQQTIHCRIVALLRKGFRVYSSAAGRHGEIISVTSDYCILKTKGGRNPAGDSTTSFVSPTSDPVVLVQEDNCWRVKNPDRVLKSTIAKRKLGRNQKKQLVTCKPNSMWLVIVEARYNVIRIDANGFGFFIPGQEFFWPLGYVSRWVKEIIAPTE